MQERSLFEYAVLRVVPRVEREEFLNIGVVLYCKKEKFLQMHFHLDEARIKCFAPELDLEVLKENILAFERICDGKRDGGAIAELDIASRFRWLTATRSTVLQTSKVHPGLCVSAVAAVEKLMEEQVF